MNGASGRLTEPLSTEGAADRLGQAVTRHFWLLVLAILFVGLVYRLPGIASRSLWIDELYTEWFAARSFTELWRDVPYYETHPPIYYTLLRLWTQAFGNSELGLRSLSLVASMATILSLALSGRLLKTGWHAQAAGLAGAALLAVNYASIRDAQNARPYALQTLVFTIAIIAAAMLVTRLARQANGEEAGRWLPPALVLGLSAGIALWFHNTSLFICLGIWSGLALTLSVFPRQMRLKAFGIYFAAGILALLVWSPYVPIFIEQSRIFMGLAFWLQPKLRDLYSAWLLVIGDHWAMLLLALALLAFGLYTLWRKAPPLALFVLAVLLVPLCVMLAVSFTLKPIYIQRLFAWMVPLALAVVAFGIVGATRQVWPRIALVCLVLVLAGTRSIADFSRPIDDWKAIVSEIAGNAEPGDVVIAVPAEGSIAVGYYARRHANFPPVVCVPGCYPQRNLPRTYMSNFGAPKLIEEDGAIVEEALKNHRRVWLVQVSVALYDPKGIVRKRIESARSFVRYYGNSLAKVELFE
jgi:mannosyltransferase